jgi:regulatory protein
MPENTLFKTALKKAMDLCAHQELCCSDIKKKLQSWGVDPVDSERITDILVLENFLNEARFSQAFVKDKFNYNKWGRVKIASHLRAKNIPGDIVKASLKTIDNEHYIKVLNDIITAHRRSVKARNGYELKAKLLRYGLSKGFESNLLYDLLNVPED